VLDLAQVLADPIFSEPSMNAFLAQGEPGGAMSGPASPPC